MDWLLTDLLLAFKYHGKNQGLLCSWIELHNSEDMGKTDRFSEFPLLWELIKTCLFWCCLLWCKFLLFGELAVLYLVPNPILGTDGIYKMHNNLKMVYLIVKIICSCVKETRNRNKCLIMLFCCFFCGFLFLFFLSLWFCYDYGS